MGRKARLKRERRATVAKREDGLDLLRQRMSPLGISTTTEPMPGTRKLSETLMELIQPLVQRLDPRFRTKETVETVLKVATLVWNSDVLPSAAFDTALSNLSSGHDDPEQIQEVVHLLRARRRSLFPDDRRLITDVVVTHRPDGRLDVSAAYAAQDDIV